MSAMIRMKQQDKDAWLEALRSGKYKQGRDQLRTLDGGYCCLGVLQDVLDGEVETYYTGGSWSLPSAGWINDKGIQTYDRRFTYDHVGHCLSGDNDKGKSFSEIADIIEKVVEGY